MPALITLTLNPALDLATTTDHVAPTHKLRCGPVQRFAGGGGINVARVLHRLGADVCAWALVGGAAGTQVRQLLAAEGVPTLLQPISGDTRENFSVVETTTSQEFRFVLPGPTLQPAEWQACLDALATHTPPPRWLIASGSLPPGTPDDFYAQPTPAVSGLRGWGRRCRPGGRWSSPACASCATCCTSPWNRRRTGALPPNRWFAAAPPRSWRCQWANKARYWPRARACGKRQPSTYPPPPAPRARATVFWRPWSGRWTGAMRRPRPCAGAWRPERPRCCTLAPRSHRRMTCGGWCAVCPRRWRSPPSHSTAPAAPAPACDNRAFRNFYLGTGPFGPQAQ